MAEKRAQYILEDAWKFPQLGTPKQHKWLVKHAKELGYDSMTEFVAAFKKVAVRATVNYLPDGNIDSLTAHNFFHFLRGYRIPRKGAAKGGGNDFVSAPTDSLYDKGEREEN